MLPGLVRRLSCGAALVRRPNRRRALATRSHCTLHNEDRIVTIGNRGGAVGSSGACSRVTADRIGAARQITENDVRTRADEIDYEKKCIFGRDQTASVMKKRATKKPNSSDMFRCMSVEP
jgi:hypothetical protein